MQKVSWHPAFVILLLLRHLTNFYHITINIPVLSNGDIEIGVHIADVTYFLQHRSSLDKEAGRRATTFYLVDRRFDMLPSLLSSGKVS